ncbi:MAG TPA: GNAT family N-acetyltransferase [Trebonia sp.]
MTDPPRIRRWQPADTAALRGIQAAWAAALDIDDPDGSRMSAPVLGAWLSLGFTGDPAGTGYSPGPEPGHVAGWYRLQLPDLENQDRADLLIVVRPDCRRRGLGRALLRHAARRAAAAGYSLVRWTGPTPPEYQEPLARVLNAYADAPTTKACRPKAGTRAGCGSGLTPRWRLWGCVPAQ